MDDATITLVGGMRLTRPAISDVRLAMLIWGKAGCGKTTLASTAPGTKLYLLFDYHGDQSIVARDDCFVLNLSGAGHMTIKEFEKDDPFKLAAILEQHKEIETIVVDSLTRLWDLALEHAVAISRSSTTVLPGQNGYAARNTLVKRAVTSLMRLCERHARHLIFIAHEGSPRTNEEGATIEVPTILTSTLIEPIVISLSEVWWMDDTGKERRIAVRPVRLRKLMKTRMFDARVVQEFVWRYDSETMKGDGIAEWFKAWNNNGGHKLSLPK